IIDGMEMDLTQSRYLDFPGLERYCYHVAGAVGILAAGIFGYGNPRTLDYARNLGTAFQLTNIIRDVGEDARKNRIYLPMDDLKRFEVPAQDILQSKNSDNFGKLMQFQARRAESFYEKAMQALPAEDRKAQRSGLIMAAIYRATLQEIERDGFKVLTQRTSLTPLRKLWIAWTTWVSG
ncbi:MAG: squalene/phytoene synthase family protein, partial [Burkholderiales bacterium]